MGRPGATCAEAGRIEELLERATAEPRDSWRVATARERDSSTPPRSQLGERSTGELPSPSVSSGPETSCVRPPGSSLVAEEPLSWERGHRPHHDSNAHLGYGRDDCAEGDRSGRESNPEPAEAGVAPMPPLQPMKGYAI